MRAKGDNSWRDLEEKGQVMAGMEQMRRFEKICESSSLMYN